MANACAEPLPSDAKACIHLDDDATHRRIIKYMALPTHTHPHSRRILQPCNRKGVPSSFDVAALAWTPLGGSMEHFGMVARLVLMLMRCGCCESRAWLKNLDAFENNLAIFTYVLTVLLYIANEYKRSLWRRWILHL